MRIILRADSGFARDALMAWCEAEGVDFIFGLAKNARLVRAIGDELWPPARRAETTGQPARRFKDFTWTTRKSWSRERRVIGKAEWTQGKANPRFIVTSLTAADGDGRKLYETVYCARGEMENRIKECQLDLFADRTSTATMRANQLRLWFASMAYVLVESVRRLALQATDLANATCGTIRRKLFKIGALVTISVRRVKLAMASGCPYKTAFAAAHRALNRRRHQLKKLPARRHRGTDVTGKPGSAGAPAATLIACSHARPDSLLANAPPSTAPDHKIGCAKPLEVSKIECFGRPVKTSVRYPG